MQGLRRAPTPEPSLTDDLAPLFTRRVRLPLVGADESCRFPKRVTRNTDHSGERFHMLTLLERDYVDRGKATATQPRYICRCDCGTVKSIRWSSIRTGRTKSCGCLPPANAHARYSDTHRQSAEDARRRVAELAAEAEARREAARPSFEHRTPEEWRALAEAVGQVVRETPDDLLRKALMRIFEALD